MNKAHKHVLNLDPLGSAEDLAWETFRLAYRIGVRPEHAVEWLLQATVAEAKGLVRLKPFAWTTPLLLTLRAMKESENTVNVVVHGLDGFLLRVQTRFGCTTAHSVASVLRYAEENFADTLTIQK